MQEVQKGSTMCVRRSETLRLSPEKAKAAAERLFPAAPNPAQATNAEMGLDPTGHRENADGRVLFCWMTERKSKAGETYFMANGMGATRMLMIRGQEQRIDPSGRPIWKVYVIPRDDIATIAPDGSARGTKRKAD